MPWTEQIDVYGEVQRLQALGVSLQTTLVTVNATDMVNKFVQMFLLGGVMDIISLGHGRKCLVYPSSGCVIGNKVTEGIFWKQENASMQKL